MGKQGERQSSTTIGPPPLWEPDALDHELLQSAAAKRKNGKQLNRQEAAVVRKLAASKEEQQRWRHYTTIPQKHWIKMSGRQWKVIREQADLYGISFADAVIDLPKVVRQIHDFFAKHFRKFMAPDDPDGELVEGASKNLKDEYVRQKTRIERMKADEMERKAVYWDALQPALVDLGTALRKAGELQARKYGPDCALILEEAIGEYERKLDELMGGDR